MAADPRDLTDLATARTWLGLAPGPTDVALQLAITAVSCRIASWCSRDLVRTDHVEIYDGTGGARLMLRNYPVVAVFAVTVDGRSLPTSGWRHDRRRALDLTTDRFGPGRSNVEVAYTAGFDPVPPDLAMACLDWLKVGYLARDRDPTLIAQRAADHEERYAANAAIASINGRSVPMPASVLAVLGQYQNTLAA